MESLKGKCVLITGASSGIGLALAKECALRGADLILLARRLDRLQSVANELKPFGTRVVVSRCDVTKEGDLENSVSEGLRILGRIDIVVAGAGFSIWGNLDKLTMDDYHRQFDTNIFGVLRTIYATLSELKKNQGTLVLMGSVSGYVSLPGVSAYAMSKAAIHALARSITPELGRHKISVVLIAPGFVESEIRRVNNYGEFQTTAIDPVSKKLQMSSQRAAQVILNATLARKSEQVITAHGKVAVFIQRHFPWVISLLVNRQILRWRSNQSKQAKGD